MSQRKSRKNTKRTIRTTPSTTFAGRQMRVAPTEKRDRLTALHRQGNFEQVRDCARKIVEEYPEDAFAWTALGSSLIKLKSYEEALWALDTANSLFPDDYLILDALAKAHTWLGNHRQAIAEQRRCLELEPEYAPGHFHMAALLNESGSPEALEHLDKAESLGHDIAEVLSLRGSVQTALLQFNAALATFKRLLEIRPNDPSTQNNIANLYKDIGQFRKAEEAYRQALELDPEFVMAYSNQFFSMHYDPERTPESILEFAKEWEKRFAPPYRLESPKEANLLPNKRLRVGLLSSGLRQHPVGQMITAALEKLDDSVELYAYSTNNIHDHITERIRNAVASWQPIGHLGEPQLAEKIRQDGIDILIDLSGHGAGNRLRTVSMRPAPIAVKWVGGLVNSMGLESFDYLLSDPIETPSGVDHLYVEKLIRMPDDYICYLPPDYLPPITALPAITNGYITLGCFNNPAKINPVLLAEWAILMQQISNSRLLLKGAQYDNPEFREHIREILLGHGIEAERLILEGPSSHKDLLETYNRIDIALDPWPYSGGLTTCEAMLMGVPVVTFPGPTFAGRHSATHLVNAGMPELLTNSWEEYRQRVIELASDWPNLSVIRACLRRVLLQSPVCDGPRFARHFTTAMRAIWQRHCEGKAPAALTLDKEGQAWFEGDSQSVRLQYPPVDVASKVGFDFALQDKIITLDNGGLLIGDPKFAELQKLDTFATIAFDPASKVRNVQQLQQQGELHHYLQVVLGDGQEATLFACLDPTMSATLAPLPAEHQLPGNEQATHVIAKLPIATLRLDDIEGLESIDWLLLDNLNDSLKILENGEKALSNTLLVQARVNFLPTHYHQPELTQISHWLCRHGFGFHRLNNLTHASHLPERDDLPKPQATQLIYADALFVPDAERMAKLKENQRIKLAFLLHTVYGMKDLTHWLLAQVDKEKAEQYLVSEGMLTAPQANPRPQISKTSTAEIPLAKLVFFPDYSHANPYQKLLYSIFPQNISIVPGLPWELPVTLCENRIFHLHWEDIIYRDAKSEKEACSLVDDFLEKIRSTKACGWKILWTIHNEAPHENRFPATDRHIRSKLSSLADMALVHSEAARIIQEKDLPELKGKIHTLPIGSYEGYYVNCTSRTKARAKLEIAEHKNVFLFFGNIRPYKGLADLLKAFSSPEIQKTDSILIIAGLGPAYQYIEKYYTGNPEKLKVVNRHIQDDEVQDYFVSADFCVFSFKKILTSSSVLLSYTFSIPVIIPDFASMTEFTGEERGSVSYQNNNVNSLKKAILKCCEMPFGEKKELKKQASSVLTEYRWQNFSRVAHKIISELNDPKNLLTYEPEKTDSMGENLHHALSLTILVFGKDVQDIKKWIEKHKETWPRKHRLVFAFCQGNKSSLEQAIPENMSATISESQDEDLVRRITKSLEKIESDFVLLCAADDELLKVPETMNQTSTQSLPDVVGYSGAITFRYSDGNLKAAQTNELDLSASDRSERLANYWTPPFPADNSIFYSIFKTPYLIDAFNRMGSSSYEAWDWVCMSAILNIGRIEKCDLMILREKTPSLHYTKSYIEKNKGEPLKNPLSKASHRLKKILPTAQYQAISPGLTQWLEIKKREVDFLLEKTQHNTALKTTNIDQPNKKPITVGGGKI